MVFRLSPEFLLCLQLSRASKKIPFNSQTRKFRYRCTSNESFVHNYIVDDKITPNLSRINYPILCTMITEKSDESPGRHFQTSLDSSCGMNFRCSLPRFPGLGILDLFKFYMHEDMQNARLPVEDDQV